MNIFLVGNGPTSDLNDIIDRADLVVRMNTVPTFGKTTGTKTDILVLVNTGSPGLELLSLKGVMSNPAFKLAREIRLPVCPERAAVRRAAHPERSNQMSEWSHLTKHEVYRDKIITNVHGHIAAKLEAKLNSPVPSTGMTITEQFVTNFQRGHKIHLCGFEHKGWDGHPWEAEKALTNSYVDQGLIIRVD